MTQIDLADQLGVPFLGFILNRHPVTIGIMLALISPLLPMYVFKPLVDGVFPRWGDMWLSFRFDLAIAFAGFVLALYCYYRLPSGFRLGPKWVTWGLAAVFVVGGMALAVWHMYQERGQAEHTNPVAVYHNAFLYIILPLTVGMLAIAVVKHLWQSPNWAAALALAVLVACIGGWVWAGMYDGKHQTNAEGVSKHQLAHSANWRWWQDDWHGYKDLGLSFRRMLHLSP